MQNVRFSGHALERLRQRKISPEAVFAVLNHGWRRLIVGGRYIHQICEVSAWHLFRQGLIPNMDCAGLEVVIEVAPSSGTVVVVTAYYSDNGQARQLWGGV